MMANGDEKSRKQHAASHVDTRLHPPAQVAKKPQTPAKWLHWSRRNFTRREISDPVTQHKRESWRTRVDRAVSWIGFVCWGAGCIKAEFRGVAPQEASTWHSVALTGASGRDAITARELDASGDGCRNHGHGAPERMKQIAEDRGGARLPLACGAISRRWPETSAPRLASVRID
jgi:hypothetical protein